MPYFFIICFENGCIILFKHVQTFMETNISGKLESETFYSSAQCELSLAAFL